MVACKLARLKLPNPSSLLELAWKRIDCESGRWCFQIERWFSLDMGPTRKIATEHGDDGGLVGAK